MPKNPDTITDKPEDRRGNPATSAKAMAANAVRELAEVDKRGRSPAQWRGLIAKVGGEVEADRRREPAIKEAMRRVALGARDGETADIKALAALNQELAALRVRADIAEATLEAAQEGLAEAEARVAQEVEVRRRAEVDALGLKILAEASRVDEGFAVANSALIARHGLIRRLAKLDPAKAAIMLSRSGGCVGGAMATAGLGDHATIDRPERGRRRTLRTNDQVMLAAVMTLGATADAEGVAA